MTTCDMNFERISGSVELDERGELHNGIWDSNLLVKRKIEEDDEAFELYLSVDDEGLFFGMTAHHIENEETKRVFHANLRSKLEWQDARRLRDFLNIVLNWQSEIP